MNMLMHFGNSPMNENDFWPYWVKSRGDKVQIVVIWIIILLGAASLIALPIVVGCDGKL